MYFQDSASSAGEALAGRSRTRAAGPRPVVQSPTTPAESGDSSGSDSSEISGVSGESRLEGEGVAEAIGVIRSCQDKGESLWTPGVVCRLFGTPELPHKFFPEAAKAMAEQAAAAPEATAIDPTAAAASTDTAAGAAVVPPTPGTEPKSPHSLPSVIFRPGRLIEKTLMIEAADGSSVPVPPAIPKRHPLPQPPPAPSSQSSPTPNLAGWALHCWSVSDTSGRGFGRRFGAGSFDTTRRAGREDCRRSTCACGGLR